MKLYAIFDKNGTIVLPKHNWDGIACGNQWAAWLNAGFGDAAAIRRAKRAGYTCEEVEIVRKGKE